MTPSAPLPAPASVLSLSRRPRRLLAALLAALTTFIVLGSAVGFAAANDEDTHSRLPAEFAIASPRIGDHALYDVDGLGNATAFSIERGEPAPVRDRHGDRVLAEPDGLWYEVGTGRILGGGYSDWSQHEEVDTSRNPLSTAEHWSIEDLRGSWWFPLDDARDCWRHNAFQGHAVPLHAPVAVFGACTLHGETLPAGLHLRAVGVETIAGHAAVRFVGGPITVWFAPAVPYPVAVDLQRSNDTVATFRLTAFEPGTVPVAMDPRVIAADPAPRLRYTTPPAWGFDFAGIDHPFPPDAAFAAARTDPLWSVLRDWEALHPDNILRDARFDHDENSRTNIDEWRFTLTAATSELDFHIIRTTATDAPDAPPRYELEGGSSPARADRIPQDIPAAWPTAHSIQERLRAYTHAAVADLNITNIRPLFACQGAPCDQPHLILAEGERRIHSDPNLGALLGGADENSRVRALMAWDGTLVEYNEHVDRTSTEPTLLADPDDAPIRTPPPTSDAPPTPLATTAPTWTTPTAASAAGAGIAAVLVGALVWLWPSLKGLPALGLFSRIRRHDLLGHPARRRIVDAVKAHPGIHFGKLLRHLDLSNGAAVHHLRKLTDAGLLRAHTGQGYTCYFVADADPNLVDAANVLRTDAARTLLSRIAEHPGRATAEIADAAHLPPATASHHLKRLRAAGLVAGTRDGRAIRLAPTEAGLRALGSLMVA